MTVEEKLEGDIEELLMEAIPVFWRGFLKDAVQENCKKTSKNITNAIQEYVEAKIIEHNVNMPHMPL